VNAVLQTSGLEKAYGRRWALRDCTLKIPEGKVVGLVGPNGAGKTTLLHLAVGLLAPTSGTTRCSADIPLMARHNWHGSASSPRTPPRTQV
jgi:ABC-2 type transport system ATP-binding protein